MPKEVVDKVTVTLQVSELSPDRLDYKPYAATFTHDNLFVEVEVPEKEALRFGAAGTTLTPKGFAYLLDEICSAYEAVQNEHHKKLIE